MGSEIVKVKEGLEQLVAKHNDALAATPRPVVRQQFSLDEIVKSKVEMAAGANLLSSALCTLIGGMTVIGLAIMGMPELSESFPSAPAFLCGWFIASIFPVVFVDKTARIVKRFFPKWAKKKERLHAMREIENNLEYKKQMAEHTAVYAKAHKELAPVLQELNTSALATMVNVEYVLTAKGIEATPRNK